MADLNIFPISLLESRKQATSTIHLIDERAAVWLLPMKKLTLTSLSIILKNGLLWRELCSCHQASIMLYETIAVSLFIRTHALTTRALATRATSLLKYSCLQILKQKERLLTVYMQALPIPLLRQGIFLSISFLWIKEYRSRAYQYYSKFHCRSLQVKCFC